MKQCPFCAEQIQDEAVICRLCQRPLTPGAATTIPTAPVSTWSPGVAAVLSFLVPGLGQLYKGHIARGIVLLFVTLLGYFALIVPGIIIHILVIVDAYNGKTKEQEQVTRAAIIAADPRTPEQRRADQRRSNRQMAVAGTGIIGLMVLLWTVAYFLDGSDRPRSSRIERAPATGPIDPMLATIEHSDDHDWQQRLQRATVNAGQTCERINSAFHQGLRAGESFWNIRCAGDETYAVIFKSGAEPRAIPCSQLKRVANAECYASFPLR